MFNGLYQLPWWGYVIVALVLTQITIASVTLFLHRHQAHKSLELSPVLSHFFRFWLWLTTGMVTKEWVAIHRKHHAKVETEEDPHSPQVHGLNKVLRAGAELYQQEARNRDTMQQYGQGTPDDWLERHIYAKHPVVGVSALLIIQFALFGILGITIWAIQMAWIPFWAAGVINGVGHYWGYRNSESPDTSRNIVPWALIVGGEELHNNHHAYPQSAKFSLKPWEFDIGWLYIVIFKKLGLAKVKHQAPMLKQAAKQKVDMETLKALFASRFEILSGYTHQVIIPVLKQERRKASITTHRMLKRTKKLLTRSEVLVDDADKAYLRKVLEKYQTLQVVYQFKQKLQSIWQKTASNQKELLEALQEWCQQAENTGIEALKDFAQTIKAYHIEQPHLS